MTERKPIEWNRFGLNNDPEKEVSEKTKLKEDTAEGYYGGGEGEELFSTEEFKRNKPWWLITLLMSERTLFGTWDGVFTSCMVNFLGAILFLRTGWVVAQAGIVYGSIMMFVTVIVGLSTTLSVIGILSLTKIESGGVYFLVSHVLGSRIGGAIGLVYCFGQIIGVALSFVGFGESMTELLKLDNVWVERGFATGALLILAVINFSGVKSVIKITIILCLVIILSLLDFYVGTFLQHDADKGVVGWSIECWRNNLWQNYTSGYSWFTVFGVFFPSITGIMSGLNMSGDLRFPERDISVGTLFALAFSLVSYLLVVFILGGTVKRDVLRVDFLVMEKVSASGIILLLGLYTSTLACPLVSLYGTPRVLQSIAGEHVIPVMKALEMGKGPNKLPILSLVVTVMITFLFLLIGRINVLAPIMSMPFLVTYAAIDYAYFTLAVTYDHASGTSSKTPFFTKPTFSRGSAFGKTDLDELFPERITRKKVITRSTASSESSSPSENPGVPTPPKTTKSSSHESLKDECMIGEGAEGENELINLSNYPTGKKSQAWYFALTSKWMSLIGALVKVALMFAINWVYGLTGIVIVALLYYYIATTAPGVPPGIAANFNIFRYMKHKFLICIGRPSNDYDEIVVAPLHPGVQVAASQLTKENLDFAARSKFHHSKNYVN